MRFSLVTDLSWARLRYAIGAAFSDAPRMTVAVLSSIGIALVCALVGSYELWRIRADEIAHPAPAPAVAKKSGDSVRAFEGRLTDPDIVVAELYRVAQQTGLAIDDLAIVSETGAVAKLIRKRLSFSARSSFAEQRNFFVVMQESFPNLVIDAYQCSRLEQPIGAIRCELQVSVFAQSNDAGIP